MTIELVNDGRVRQGATASMRPTALALAMRDGREVGVADCRTVVRWSVTDSAGAPDTLTLPPSTTAHDPARWVVSTGSGLRTPPRLPAVLSVAGQTVGV